MTDKEWQPPKDVKPWIVCAANRNQNCGIICGVRHWDVIMTPQIMRMHTPVWEQGFVDQWGRFHTREEAYKIVQDNGQPFNADRNGSDTELFSEGLY